MISLFKRLGDGNGESDEGKNLDLDLKKSCLDSEPTSKQARIGVQLNLAWSWRSDSFEEKALPELHTYTERLGQHCIQRLSIAHLTLIEDG